MSRRAEGPAVVAHRGASGYLPEMTLEAFDLAIRQGADLVETDVAVTGDGELVLRHDPELSATTDISERPDLAARRRTRVVDGVEAEGWFCEDLSLDEVRTLRARERFPELRRRSARLDGSFLVPTLRELIALVHGHNADRAVRGRRPVGICVEIKHPSYWRQQGLAVEEPLLELLRETGMDGPLTWVEANELATLERLAGASDVRLIQAIMSEDRPYDLEVAGDTRTYADLLKPEGLAWSARHVQALGVAKEYVLARGPDASTLGPTTLVDEAHAAGLEVMVWTLRRENEFLPRELRRRFGPGTRGRIAAEMRAFCEAGVDGVFTDHPDLVVRARNRWLRAQALRPQTLRARGR
ncbi:glycerophosphoryl diester phosphodiesterase [Mumia flava]|uniref:glycerophosphodiester phosphodiesterase n=1 Tax=Mumia flava TaxID=1348852 RepID=A0A2M9BKE7_9ACTN|nr:glycerophosphodiester phosphodiesterase family protein [Mumia flava]PJJ58418.1 glycerophosphoryl diester phosphodiesterase [Mumia flava]